MALKSVKSKKTSGGGGSSASDDNAIIDSVWRSREEAKRARFDRIGQNRQNFDTYHLKQDWSHKIDGQSREFLARQMMAVEQLTAFAKQGVVKMDDWFDVVAMPGMTDPRIRDVDVKKLLSYQLTRADLYSNFEETMKLGLLGSLMIMKVHGRWVPKPKYVADINVRTNKRELKLRTDLKWELALEPIIQEDYYPDPTGRGLYEIQEMEVDWFDLQRMARTAANPKGIYDPKVVAKLKGKDGRDLLDESRRDRVKGQNQVFGEGRPRIKIREFWGTLLDTRGDVIMENCVCAVANDKWLIRAPEENPFWHKRSPFVVAPLVRVPKSVWHKALMDAPTKHNHALNEIYNLNLDNAMLAAYGVREVQPDYLEDESQIEDGIKPGTTLVRRASAPPNVPVMSRVDTSTMSPESLQMFQVTSTELNSSTLTNDLRIGAGAGNGPSATAVVESSQTITSQLTGMTEAIEDKFMRPVLELSWMTILQHMDDFNIAEVRKVLGDSVAQIIGSMDAVERFAGTVNGISFKVYGFSYTLNKLRDFRRLTTLLQTVFSNQLLVESFLKKYDPSKLLEEIMKTLDLNTDKLETNQVEEARLAMARLLNGASPGGPTQPGADVSIGALAGAGGGPNVASQIPGASSVRSGSTAGGGPAQSSGPGAPTGVPATQFPASRATPVNPEGTAQ